MPFPVRLPVLLALAVSALAAYAAPPVPQRVGPPVIEEWLTTPDRTSLLAEQPNRLRFATVTPLPATGEVIQVDDTKTFQTIDGFGWALTGGSAQLLMRMHADKRAALLQELFGKGPNSAGGSYLRVSIGSSDMNDHVYTYDDLPAGETDPTLAKFSLAEDEHDVIPVLKEILAIHPGMPILASPWSAPAWMKTNGLMKGGTLKPEDYDVYAHYLARYVERMRAAGIPIATMTLQNEPENPKNTPSLTLTAEQEAALLKAVGPVFHAAGLTTKFVLFDHNCDHPEYPLAILADPDAARYADGSGFHLYEGEITALAKVRDEHPDKNIYFTEQMIIDKPGASELAIAKPVERVVVGATTNGSRNVLLWNLAADPQLGPHTSDGGCPVCEGAVTLDGDTVTRNLAFYTVAQVAKFVPPGSVRIAATSSVADNASAQVAFRTPAGKLVLLVANTSAVPRAFRMEINGRGSMASVPAGAAATFVW